MNIKNKKVIKNVNEIKTTKKLMEKKKLMKENTNNEKANEYKHERIECKYKEKYIMMMDEEITTENKNKEKYCEDKYIS